jgi:hypothetical protein
VRGRVGCANAITLLVVLVDPSGEQVTAMDGDRGRPVAVVVGDPAVWRDELERAMGEGFQTPFRLQIGNSRSANLVLAPHSLLWSFQVQNGPFASRAARQASAFDAARPRSRFRLSAYASAARAATARAQIASIPVRTSSHRARR